MKKKTYTELMKGRKAIPFAEYMRWKEPILAMFMDLQNEMYQLKQEIKKEREERKEQEEIRKKKNKIRGTNISKGMKAAAKKHGYKYGGPRKSKLDAKKLKLLPKLAKRGLTQREIARRLGVTPARICQLLKQKGEPK